MELTVILSILFVVLMIGVLLGYAAKQHHELIEVHDRTEELRIENAELNRELGEVQDRAEGLLRENIELMAANKSYEVSLGLVLGEIEKQS